MTGYYYAHNITGLLLISQQQLTNADYTQVDTLPNGAGYKYDFTNSRWTKLTEAEIEESYVVPPTVEEQPNKIEPPKTTIPDSIPYWVDANGKSLRGSEITLLNSKIINTPEDGDFYLNGRSIIRLDCQKIIVTSQDNYDGNDWETIAGMSLISTNSFPAFYWVEAELLVKTSKNNRDFEFAIFINSEQSTDNTLLIDFKSSYDNKCLKWSDEIELQPNSIVEVKWRKATSSVTCFCDRRKLSLKENFPCHSY